MNRQLIVLLGLAISAPAMAGSFDGTWKADVNFTQVNPRSKIYSVTNGVYRCTSCIHPYSIPADGKPHTVPIDENGNVETVSVVNARTVVIKDLKGDQLIASVTMTAMPGGKTLRVTSREIGANGKYVTSQELRRRVAPGPKGSHAISGSWKDTKVEKVDAAALIIALRETDGTLHMKAATGESYDARIGGPAVPVKGDRQGTMVSLRRPSPMTLVETDTVDGKVVAVNTMVIVNPTTMKIAAEDKQRGGVSRFVAHKQVSQKR